tara:strand:+ start:472 stop:894 length:423 start_codon:yes stop_codon:yes gene_type:complete
MKKINSSLEDFVKKQEERRKYMRTYMKAARKKGLHSAHRPDYVKKVSKEKIEMEFDARYLYDIINKSAKLATETEKKHHKEIQLLQNCILKQSKQHFFNIDLLRKYQDSQEMLIVRMQDQEKDIEDLLTKIRKLKNDRLH